jgi:hypothetical protein
MQRKQYLAKGVYPAEDSIEGVKLEGVMYNTSYGGFGYSQIALDEYEKRTNKHPTEDDEIFGSQPSRFDTIMIQIVKDLGKIASDKYSDIGIAYVRPEHVDFVKFDEYDGLETLSIDWNLYALVSVYKIIQSNDDPGEKIKKIASIYEANPQITECYGDA